MKRLASVGVMGFGILVLGMQTASAIPVHTASLMISDGTSAVTIADNGPGDLSPLAGVILYGGVLNNWSINVTSGASKPNLGSTSSPDLDLFSLYVSGGGGSLTVQFSDTGFALSSLSPTFISQASGKSSGSVTLNTYLDRGNTLSFGPEDLLASLLYPTPGPYSGSAVSIVDPLYSNMPFSLSEVVTITHGFGLSATSIDAQVMLPVPEPGTLFLLGSGLATMGLWKLRKK